MWTPDGWFADIVMTKVTVVVSNLRLMIENFRKVRELLSVA